MGWLNRTLITGPYLALAASEKEYLRLVQSLKIPKKTINKWVPDGASAAAHVFESDFGYPACIVCINADIDANPIKIASFLVHEAVHVWQHFSEYIGETKPSDEFEAYCIESISFELMSEYHKKMQKSGMKSA